MQANESHSPRELIAQIEFVSVNGKTDHINLVRWIVVIGKTNRKGDQRLYRWFSGTRPVRGENTSSTKCAWVDCVFDAWLIWWAQARRHRHCRRRRHRQSSPWSNRQKNAKWLRITVCTCVCRGGGEAANLCKFIAESFAISRWGRKVKLGSWRPTDWAMKIPITMHFTREPFESLWNTHTQIRRWT